MKNWQFFLLLSQLNFMMASPKSESVLVVGVGFGVAAIYEAYRERKARRG
jgi:hypothetical protein